MQQADEGEQIADMERASRRVDAQVHRHRLLDVLPRGPAAQESLSAQFCRVNRIMKHLVSSESIPRCSSSRTTFRLARVDAKVRAACRDGRLVR